VDASTKSATAITATTAATVAHAMMATIAIPIQIGRAEGTQLWIESAFDSSKFALAG
jgi:hypothetical protein